MSKYTFGITQSARRLSRELAVRKTHLKSHYIEPFGSGTPAYTFGITYKSQTAISLSRRISSKKDALKIPIYRAIWIRNSSIICMLVVCTPVVTKCSHTQPSDSV
jgi:hypothetical protein